MTDLEIPIALKQRISSNEAFHYRIVPTKEDQGVVELHTDSDAINSLHQELKIVLSFDFKLLEIDSELLNSYLSKNYRQTTSVSTSALNQTEFLTTLLNTAKEFGSSDIHMEPYENFGRIRFRLDGNLKTQYQIPRSQYPQLVNQIKIKSDLDISQKRLSQDGRISINAATEQFDIRVSTLPTLHGEKVVLRILKRNAEAVSLDTLGFTPSELESYLEGIKNPNGIILISGPTGSGKTTTLYGTLRELNKEKSNIVTIEDPIEYTLEGINQVQLKEEIGFDFPKALRTFLRQDPDIIMVGEIRDEQTANMAVKASLTGHLVLSTIHTNSAWATISRLTDMGVPAYLLANTLTMSVAQRLVRKLCSHCKKKQQAVDSDFPKSFKPDQPIAQHYVSVGCDRCYFTGYSGRKAIYEIIPITPELELAIRDNRLQIDAYLSQNNIATLKSNAISLVRQGVTSVAEVYGILK